MIKKICKTLNWNINCYFFRVLWGAKIGLKYLVSCMFTLICNVRITAASDPRVTIVRKLSLGAVSMQLQSLGTSTICCHPQIGYKVIRQWRAACLTIFAVCLCPGCDCWLITKPHIFCRSAIHCCSSDWQWKKKEYRYVKLTQILQEGFCLQIKLGLKHQENKYIENIGSS